MFLILYKTFSTTCTLEDRSLWILDWEAIVSSVVSMMNSGRTCLSFSQTLQNVHFSETQEKFSPSQRFFIHLSVEAKEK